MNDDNKNRLLTLLEKHKSLGISEQIDYNKFYLYSIITHSTAIEGSTVTEVEAQLLFDEGITSNKRTVVEQMMNIDLKAAYEYGIEWIKEHRPITVEWLVTLSSKVMAHTGSEYHSIGGDFDSSKGELRKLNVTAGVGGKSYLSYLSVPKRLEEFCTELNKRRSTLDKEDIAKIYELSFWAHFVLVSIHPWADGNGRASRLLMNLLQIEFGVLPSKVQKEDKSEYIQALIDTRESEDTDIFVNYMTSMHCNHLQSDISEFISSSSEKVVDKSTIFSDLTGKWSIKPSLASKLADIIIYSSNKIDVTTEMIVAEFGFSETSSKRYLRQLTEFGYFTASGGNRNRKYQPLLF